MAADPYLGRTLGRYRLDARLGEGGMALVYQAHDPAVDRTVAVKIVKPHLAADPQFTARFLREAQAVARLQHPHILPLYDFGTQDGVPYLVMPDVAGGTLQDRLQTGLTSATTLALLQPIAEALDYAHAQGIVHRDVKPSNILITAAGAPLLADFGIAQVVGAATLTASGVQLGSVPYSAPEQLTGQPLTGQADLYALGVVAYEALTGDVPFPLTSSDTPFSAALRRLQATPPPAHTVNPTLPSAVDPVLARALAAEPAARYPTGAAFLTALTAALGPTSVTETPGVVAPPAVPFPPTRVSRPARASRLALPWLLAGIAAAVLVLCLGGSGVAALGVLHRQRGPTPTVVSFAPVPTAIAHSAALAPTILPPTPTTTRPPTPLVVTATPLPPAPSPSPTAVAAAVATRPATATPVPTRTATPLPTPTTIPPTSTSPPPPATATPPPSAPASAADAALQATAQRAILGLPGTSSGVFASLTTPADSFADAPTMVLPAGSLIKLPIAGAVYERVALGQWRLTDTLTLTAATKTEGTGILKNQPTGSVYSLDQLVEIMLVYSDNTASNMLIDHLGGFAPVNDFSTRLGLQHTVLRRKLFDQAAQARGIENTTTAGDLAVFLLKVGAGQVVNQAVSQRILNILIERAQTDPNWLLLQLPPGVQAAHMTATLTGFRGDAGYVVAGQQIYILVLLVEDPDESGIERAIAQASAMIYQAALQR